nr:MAG TPA: hypothetical protein [Caudoviricetes sp.]
MAFFSRFFFPSVVLSIFAATQAVLDPLSLVLSFSTSLNLFHAHSPLLTV